MKKNPIQYKNEIKKGTIIKEFRLSWKDCEFFEKQGTPTRTVFVGKKKHVFYQMTTWLRQKLRAYGIPDHKINQYVQQEDDPNEISIKTKRKVLDGLEQHPDIHRKVLQEMNR